MELSNQPTMVLWDPRFTPRHPYFRFTHRQEITKQQMVKDLFCFDAPDMINEDTDVTRLINDKYGVLLYLGTWEQFLQVATPKQIACVEECLQHVERHELPKEIEISPRAVQSIY